MMQRRSVPLTDIPDWIQGGIAKWAKFARRGGGATASVTTNGTSGATPINFSKGLLEFMSKF
jgi:hypothetical protein